MDQPLTDLIPYSGDTEVMLDWDNFSHKVSNALQKLLSRFAEHETRQRGISYSQLEGIQLSDLLQTPVMGDLLPGESLKTQIIEELREVFGDFEANGDAFVVSPEFDFDLVLEPYPDSIDMAENIEELLIAILESFDSYLKLDERNMAVLQGRNQAFLRKLRTLDEIGAEFAVTRERIRQIESKYVNLEINPPKKENSLLRAVIEILEKSQNEEEFLSGLRATNLISSEPFSLTKLKAILRIMGVESLLARFENVEASWDSQAQAQSDLGDQAKKYRNKLGLIDLSIFTSETHSSDAQAFAAIQSAYPRSILRGRLVLARTSKLDTTFENIIGKQLKVYGSLEPEVLLVGIQRHANYRQEAVLGSQSDQIALIHAVAGDEPSYEIYCENTKEEPELNPTDIWFMEIFQDSPTGTLHRNEITAASLRDGKNMSSIGISILFNPLIRPVGSSVLALANINPDAEMIKRQANVAKAAEEKTLLDFEFQGSNILLKFIPNLNTLMAGVLFPNSDLKVLIGDKVFNMVCECGELKSTQQLRLRPPSFWTGFTAAIKHAKDLHGFSKGEELKVLLDFDRNVATLRSSG